MWNLNRCYDTKALYGTQKIVSSHLEKIKLKKFSVGVTTMPRIFAQYSMKCFSFSKILLFFSFGLVCDALCGAPWAVWRCTVGPQYIPVILVVFIRSLIQTGQFDEIQIGDTCSHHMSRKAVLSREIIHLVDMWHCLFFIYFMHLWLREKRKHLPMNTNSVTKVADNKCNIHKYNYCNMWSQCEGQNSLWKWQRAADWHAGGKTSILLSFFVFLYTHI